MVWQSGEIDRRKMRDSRDVKPGSILHSHLQAIELPVMAAGRAKETAVKQALARERAEKIAGLRKLQKQYPSKFTENAVNAKIAELERKDADVVAELKQNREKAVREVQHKKVLPLYLKATRDGLTGLLNRTAFEEDARDYIESDGDFALVYIDLDNLKRVNDNFEHGWGDKYLIAARDAFVQVFRGRATVGRLGGDEFAILVPLGGTPAGTAFRSLLKLQGKDLPIILKGIFSTIFAIDTVGRLQIRWHLVLPVFPQGFHSKVSWKKMILTGCWIMQTKECTAKNRQGKSQPWLRENCLICVLNKLEN
jgi:GGDEF domain-containing protein